jgi:predicted PurR-regulated permease PerM
MVIRFISFTSISLFLAFLFILEMPANLARSFKSLSSASQREFGIMFDKLSAVWNGWLRSTVITSIIIGSSTAVELFLFGIPYAGILGVVTGFLNLVPTFGPLISYLLIIIVTYTLLVLGINLVINQVARLVIFPKLAGKATRLPIFLVILGLVVAAILWGVLGVVLVVPLLGTASEVLKYVIKKINRQDPYPGEQLQSGFWEKVIYDK